MSQLEPCPRCHRHVRITETSCPFCAHALADAFTNVVARAAPRVRLGRAATFAFGMLALGGCDEEGRRPPVDAPPVDMLVDEGSPVDADDDGGVAIYSAAPTAPKDTDDTGEKTTRG